jgi:acyl-CoA thioesterase FadM
MYYIRVQDYNQAGLRLVTFPFRRSVSSDDSSFITHITHITQQSKTMTMTMTTMVISSSRLHSSSLLFLTVLSLCGVVTSATANAAFINNINMDPLIGSYSHYSCRTRKHRTVASAVPKAASAANVGSSGMGMGIDMGIPVPVPAVTLSHAQPVYIEDTDAYGVMYNGNYLRAYDRALHTANITDSTSTGNSLPSRILGHDDQWSIVAVHHQKFKSSPALGETFRVTATLRRDNDNDITAASGSEIWDMAMQAEENSNTGGTSTTTYNTAAGVTIARPPKQEEEKDTDNNNNNDTSNNKRALSRSTTPWLPEPAPFETSYTRENSDNDNGLSTFTVFRDEFDAHLDGHLPLRSVLNLFERARSNFLGGPDKLRRLQEQDSILYVVIAIDDLSLVHWNSPNPNPTTITPDRQQDLLLSPGQKVQVTTDHVVKRKGMVLECRQTAWVQGARMAQGTVTLMALNAQTRRPTSKLPVWLQQLLD